MRYSQLIYGLQLAQVAVDRRMLADIAVHDPESFTKIVEPGRSLSCPSFRRLEERKTRGFGP